MWAARFILCIMSAFLVAAPLQAEIIAKEVEYEANGVPLVGYLAYDDAIEGERPGVLVVHEWWGLNDYARSRARQLAELGYTALALDMYGEGKQASHPDEASAFASQIAERIDDAKARFGAALTLLRAHETTDASRAAAIGYCFGGSVVLNMARAGVDLDGVVSFHGGLASLVEARPDTVKAEVLVLHGADDPFVPQDEVKDFKQEMETAGVSYRFIAYPGAVHSFTNPDADRFGEQFGMPLAYDAEADRASWQEMQAFFDRIFGE